MRWDGLRRVLVLPVAALVCVGLYGQVPASSDLQKLALPDVQKLALPRTRVARFLQSRVAGGQEAAEARVRAAAEHQAMAAGPRASNLAAAWAAVGPMQIATAQSGNVTGRVTAIAIDAADASGNTVYVGTTGGGVWRSTNAAGPVGRVSFVPLTDAQASLSVGSLAMANGVLLAGTGDANDATDSYYGAGILRSADGGLTWALVSQSTDGVAGNHGFFGMSVSGLAFSTATPTVAVAALSQAAEGTTVNARATATSRLGLYYTGDAGLTWHMATIQDGSQLVQGPGTNGGGNAATTVVWNARRQSFYAAVQGHGYYASMDGASWTRLAGQPGPGLSATACPAVGGSGCPIFRGVLAVEPTSGDMYALTVDGTNVDQGLYRDMCGAAPGCSGQVSFGIRLASAALETGVGGVISQADYNLTLAAVASGADTLLFAGTVDLYRCSVAAGCVLRNTTNAANGCTNPARVAGAQHAVAAVGSVIYVGNDGGLWRSTDGVNQTGPVCSLQDATHFDNLNGGLGSLGEVVGFAQDPTVRDTVLAGFGGLGSAGTDTVTSSWPQLATGEGGAVAMDAGNPTLWYLTTGAGVNIARCDKGAGCVAGDFATTRIGPGQVIGDVGALHAPWVLDVGFTANIVIGTCRVWRGAALGGGLWSGSNAISRPLATGVGAACPAGSAEVRSLALGGTVKVSTNGQSAGSQVIYAGMAGPNGHVFRTLAADVASSATVWSDVAGLNVTNDVANAGRFNPGGFDVSSVAVDPHDATGMTVYATVMGFSGNAIQAPHVYRSVDGGAHWLNVSSNLPDAPANSLVVDPNDANTVYLAMDTGVYVTTQIATCAAANCWSVYGTGLPGAPVVELLAGGGIATGDGRRGELRAATYGRGIWEIPLLTATSPAAAAMALTPTAVSYGTQQVGTSSAAVTITVTNTGNAPLDVSQVAVTGDFVETDKCVGTSVQPGATCGVQVQFAPTITGARSGLLTVYGNVIGGQVTAGLSGIGSAPAAIVLTPLRLTFAATSVGSTSAVQAVTVSNTGGTASGLQTTVVAGEFSIVSNSCGSSIAAGNGCTVSVVFVPTVAGVQSGTLTVVDDAGTQVASLTGTATNPATDALSVVGLTFAAQPLGTASVSQQITVTNAGDVALTSIAAQVTGGDFTVGNGCGPSLAAHSICAMTVTFVPKSVGAQVGGLTISDQFRAQAVSLTGVGLALPGVSLSPATGLGFGSDGVGLTSAAQAVTLTNNGGVLLSIGSIVASGEFSLQPGTNTCGTSLGPGGVCTVQVVFAPMAVGVRTGTVTFTDNAANSPQTVAVSGIGVDFMLAANGPSSLTVASGQTATYGLLLSSVAGAPGAAAMTCAGAPAHATCTVNPGSVGLGGATSMTVTVATGLATAAVEAPTMRWSARLVWLAVLVPAGLVWRRGRRRWPMLMLVLLTGCSTGRLIPGDTTSAVVSTPSGTYTVVVAGSSAGLVRAVSLTLVVK